MLASRAPQGRCSALFRQDGSREDRFALDLLIPSRSSQLIPQFTILLQTNSYLLEPRPFGHPGHVARRPPALQSPGLRLNLKNIQRRSPKDDPVMDNHAGTGKRSVNAVA